jgi:hypothetical protein
MSSSQATPHLFGAIQERMLHWLNGYISVPEILESQYITAPDLGDLAGIKGALSLVMDAGGAI